MRIGIYAETVKVEQKTGISRYVIGLVEALLNQNEGHTYYLYYQKKGLFEKKMGLLANHPNVKHRPVYSPGDLANTRPRIWWDYLLPFCIYKDNLDVFHGPNHLLPRTKTPTVLTIHDLAYYYMNVHGEGLDRILKSWTQRSMQIADKVITVSESTKKDCISEGCKPECVTTIYQGFESNAAGKFNQPDTQDPFILFLGTIQPRKNVTLLVKAFALAAESIPHNLVLAGAPGESYDEVMALIQENNLGERVIMKGFVTDQERQGLYLNAGCFVYPSKYEGFGLVVLEAMSYGVPVIATNNSSLPEAVGDAGMLVDSDSTQELADALVKLLTNEQLSAQLREAGFKHIKKFSWQECATRTLEVYESIR